MGYARRSWLRLCATSRKVAGPIPDGVIGIFHWHNPSGRTMALELNQPLTEMSTRNISFVVKAAGAYGWRPYQLHVPIVLKSGSLNLLEPSRAVQSCNGIALPPWRLTFWCRNYFFNFSTPCIQNVNNTGTKYVRIMKQPAFWRGKKRRVYTMFKISSTYICRINI